MSSGIKVDDGVKKKFDAWKMSKGVRESEPYLLFHIDPKTSVICEKPRKLDKMKELRAKGSSTSELADLEKLSSWDLFTSEFEDKKCVWGTYVFPFERSDNTPAEQVILISWCPEDSPIKDKMQYASSKGTLTKSLEGVGTLIQGTDRQEVSKEAVEETIKRIKK